MITSERKKQLMTEYHIHEHDTGSVQLQVALLTERINQLNKHFLRHKQDYASRRGLMQLVGQRRRFLRYLERTDKKAYQSMIGRLALRA